MAYGTGMTVPLYVVGERACRVRVHRVQQAHESHAPTPVVQRPSVSAGTQLSRVGILVAAGAYDFSARCRPVLAC
jgi:hypothetical protein